MTEPSVFAQIIDFANRPDPYPLYRSLREQPVRIEDDGTVVVSTYREIKALMHDPRVSADLDNLLPAYKAALPPPDAPGLGASFIRADPPEHDRLRRLAMRQFGPPNRPNRIDDLRPKLDAIVTRLIDGIADRGQVDLVDDVAYPFPVAVICELLGVPEEDEPRFSAWVHPIVNAMGTNDPQLLPALTDALRQLGAYLIDLAEQRRANPGEDMLSGFVTDDSPDGRIEGRDLVATVVLLLIAGHETTVNLIANATLTLLRQPDQLQRLRDQPKYAVRVVEETLRFEPSVHFVPGRSAVVDIEVAGVTIPKGHPITLVLAAGSRDPLHVDDPDRFDPDRHNLEHLGFGTGIHYCFGAALARLEGHIALQQIAGRLKGLRLVEDPPPYRPSPLLRGPIHMPIAYDEVLPAR